MIDDPVPTEPLSADAARELTERIKVTVAEALDLVEQAYLGKAWTALGYPSWAAYCGAEFTGIHRTRLSREERREVALGWAAAGMSVREIAAGLGMARSTIGDDLHPPPSGTGRSHE